MLSSALGNALSNSLYQEQSSNTETSSLSASLTKTVVNGSVDVESSLEQGTIVWEETRETYGLTLLEVMDDSTYEAFNRATSGKSEQEKELLGQSLQRLSISYVQSNMSGSLTSALSGEQESLAGIMRSNMNHIIDQQFFQQANGLLETLSGGGNNREVTNFLQAFENALVTQQSGLDILL